MFTKQITRDLRNVVKYARAVFERHMAEKVWRMEVMGQISSYVKGENR